MVAAEGGPPPVEAAAPRPLVVDASSVVWLLVPTVAGIDPTDRFAQWRRSGCPLVAPALWLAETVSAIRRLVHLRALSRERGQATLEQLLALAVETHPITHGQCRAAYAWAERLGQARTYDGFYLALAEELAVELSTADRRLANAASQVGVSWVRWIGES